MTTFIAKLKEADQAYKSGVKYLEETMLRDLKCFLFNDKKKYMVVRAIIPYQVAGSIMKSCDTLEPKLKSKYENDLSCLTWDQCANIVQTSKMITKLPGLLILDYDKLEVEADDLELLKKLTERMALNKNSKIIISISPNTEGLGNLLKGLECNCYFDFNYTTTKVNLQPPNRVKEPSLLIEAARLGDYDQVTVFIASDENLDIQDLLSNTALHKAAENGHSEIVQVLLDHGANILRNKHGKTPLHFAAEKGHIKVVDILLDRNSNINEINGRGETALHLASSSGYNNVVNTLIVHGDNINTKDESGRSPLHTAVVYHQTAVVETLLHYGAKADAVDKDGYTPLHGAAEKCFVDIVKILINYAKGISESRYVDIQNPLDDTALHKAAMNGHSEIVQVLLDHGANILRNENGKTPLHFAAEKGHIKVVDILLNRNANINEINRSGKTALHLASTQGYNNVVSLLIEYGANINTQDTFGYSPLHCAVIERNTEVAETLLHYGAKADAVDEDAYTPLHGAAEKGFVDIVNILINYAKGISKSQYVNIQNSWDNTALHEAARKGHSEIVKVLLDHGANILRNKNGKTPLHFASEKGHIKVVDTLLHYGAEADALDMSGCAALHCAAERGFMDIVIKLILRRADCRLKYKEETPAEMAARNGFSQVADYILHPEKIFKNLKPKNGPLIKRIRRPL